MIGKLKTEIQRFFDVRMEFILKKQQLSFDYMQLSKLFREEHFMPLSKWSLSPSVILHVLNDIFINNRKNIIEFGSGASSLYIAKLIKLYKLKTTFYSVESNNEWIEKLKQQLDFHELLDYVHFIHAPITPVQENLSYPGQNSWYDVDAISALLDLQSNFDLVLVDGPVGADSKFSRFSAIPFLKENLAEDYSIFLDDTNRYAEKHIINSWKNILECEPAVHDRYVVFSSRENFDVKPMALFGD